MDTSTYIEKLSKGGFTAEQVKTMATHLVAVEEKLRVTPEVLIDGIPAFPEFMRATFLVESGAVGEAVSLLLSSPLLDPNIIIKGIPADKFKQVTISVAR